LGITTANPPQVTLQPAVQPGDANWDLQVWQLVPHPNPAFIHIRAAKGLQEQYLNGHTGDGPVDLAPSTDWTKYSGTAWQIVSGSAELAQLDCRGIIQGTSFIRLAANGLGSVSLVADQTTQLTGWSMEIVPFLNYPCPDYAELKVDPQVTGWPLSDAEVLAITPLKSWTPTSNQYLPTTPRPQSPIIANDPIFVNSVDYSHGNLYVIWYRNMLAHVRYLPKNPDIVLIGDSITMRWSGDILFPAPGLPLLPQWTDQFRKYTTVNLGYGGDTTQNVLWRLDHGLLDAGTAQPLQPRLVVLLIGTNNVHQLASAFAANTQQAAGWVADGIALCVKNISQRCPKAKIVLVQVLPRYDQPNYDTYCTAVRASVEALNLVSTYPQVTLVPTATSFPSSQASTLFNDNLHLSPAGYTTYAGILQPVITSLLG